jgi:uncharacterized protein YodC (DUF2158 family)
MPEFKPGDVVRLKSGKGRCLTYSRVGDISALSLQSNPKMTVELVSETCKRVDCVWFAGAELKRAPFLAHTLVAA